MAKKTFKKTSALDILAGQATRQSEKINTETDKIKLLYLANFLKSKGFKEILEALTLLNKRGITNWELEAAGNWYDANYENSCKKLINENSLDVDCFSGLY